MLDHALKVNLANRRVEDNQCSNHYLIDISVLLSGSCDLSCDRARSRALAATSRVIPLSLRSKGGNVDFVLEKYRNVSPLEF